LDRCQSSATKSARRWHDKLSSGLTAETVIGALENAEDYKAFEAAIIADWMFSRP
jgi:hypothetical protein